MIEDDLDKFKHINDSYGHEEGDLVLKHLVRTIKTNIRSGNKVIRQGGGSSPAVTIPDFRAQVSSRPGSPLVCLITDKKKPQQVKICYPFFMNTEELAEKVRSAASEQFSRSGGPGGQNVNKVNTQVTLRIPVCLLGLSEEELTRLTGRLGKRINAAGELIIQSSETRSQTANRERALERAVLLISGALAPVRRRRPTRPSTGSKQRRLKRKKIRSDRKQSRRPPGEE
jgi:ribosome-associated protein